MVGMFDVVVTDTERKNVNGTEYLYVYILQARELKKCRVEDSTLFERLQKIPKMSVVSAEIAVIENNWENRLYVNYHMLSFDTRDTVLPKK